VGGTATRSTAAGLLAALALLAAGCGGGGGGKSAVVPDGAAPETGDAKADWPAPNGDLANTRVAWGSKIDADNVTDLGVAWAAKITATGTFGGYASTPIIADGVVYTQDLNSNVSAFDLDSGKVKWTKTYDSPSVGPNGVTLGYGHVYGATSTFAFALDADTGKEVWRSQKLTRNDNEGIDMAPAVFDHTVYVSTVPGNTKKFYAGNGVGVVWALDADTGDKQWTFNTVPEDLWDPEYKDVNSGGGLWHPPAFDDSGRMFINVANPAPWPGTKAKMWGATRPGRNLYTNSVVRLDPKTGKRIWYYQALPHDVFDWDLQLPPVIAKLDGDERVISAGKVGYVYVTDPESGKLIWKKQVGEHNGHDTVNLAALGGPDAPSLPEFPFTILPGILGGVETQLAVDDDTIYVPIVNLSTTFNSATAYKLNFAGGTGDMIALNGKDGSLKWRHHFTTPVYGAATVSNDLVFTTTFDGTLWALSRDNGNVVWREKMPAGTNATVAISGDTLVTAASYPQSKSQVAQVLAYRLDANGKPIEGGTTTGGTTTGETTTGESGNAAGKTVFSSNCASCHTLADADAHGNVGPNLDDLKPDESTVEQQVRNGGGGMPAFDGRLSDAQITAVSKYVSSVAGQGGGGDEGGGGAGP
jgi:glucose dehydrogenase